MTSTLEIYSKGLYSSWCYHKPSRTLFDCGEGFASYQGNFIFGIERVCISHGHEDHVLGLLSLVTTRNLARGDKEKPLEIYYPQNDYLIGMIKKMLEERCGHRMQYSLKWAPIRDGHFIKLDNSQEIESFQMNHQRGNIQTLGYRIVESRKRLKPEYQGKNIPELLKGGAKREDLHESFKASTFAYCLDAFDFDHYYVKDCPLVVMDCTFVDVKDRDDATHFCLQDAWELCSHAKVKKMVAAHFSPRYLFNDIEKAVKSLQSYKGSEIIPVYHNKVINV